MKAAEIMVKHGNWLFRYRSYLPLIILVFALSCMWFYRSVYASGMFWFEAVCLIISALGEMIRMIAVGYAGDQTSGRNTKQQVANEINQTGIYSLVRHPLYIGNFFIWLGIALFCRIWWLTAIFILVYWLYYERIILAEEEFLTGKFGDAYARYSEKVNAILPASWNYVQNKYYFRWKKVLRKENPSIYGTLVVYVLLNLYQGLITARTPLLARGWIIAGMIFSLAYLVLWILKKNTALLRNETQKEKNIPGE